MDRRKIMEQIKIIEDDLKKLKEKSDLSLEQYLQDEDSQDVVERRFQTSIESCINIGNHLISQLDLKMPEDYASVFYRLTSAKVIDRRLADEMADLARFRNALVHLYWRIDHKDVYRKMKKRISIIKRFLKEIYSFAKL
ncbi:MAG: type VII toxin-antitoxin system HepT family RNase toxin, partial [Candidatus Margulisiibacteriota bacterium]